MENDVRVRERVNGGDWSEILKMLYTVLSFYENYQTIKKDYDAQEISSNDEFRFRLFLKKLEMYIPGLNKFSLLKKTQISEIQHVLNFAFNQKISINCTIHNGILISGVYISLKSVMRLENTKFNCKDENLKQSDHIEVFAIKTIFIDNDIDEYLLPNLKRRLPVIFIAPTWEIVGNRNFNFNGASFIKPKKDPVRNGNHGSPGVPGQDGGLFFGVGSQFVTGNNLKISANGGNGGDGQDGLDGAKGIDSPAIKKPGSNYKNYCRDNKDYNCKDGNCESKLFWPSSSKCDYTIQASNKGTEGKNGGDGGAKGKGGQPGLIKLIELKRISGIKISASPGIDGRDGKGGKGGSGGKHRPRTPTAFYYNTKTFNTWPAKTTYAQSGKLGRTGAIKSKSISTEESSFVFSPAKIVDDYKSFLRENFKDWFLTYYIREFLTEIESNDKIFKLYNARGFAHDLFSLENQFGLLKTETYLISFYKSLEHRISKYRKSLESSELFASTNSTQNIKNLIEEKNLLKYLHMAVLSARNKLNENESHLIVDIGEFLNRLKAQFFELRQKQDKALVTNIINEHLEKYSKSIAIKQREGMEVINNDISVEMNRILIATNDAVEKLGVEVQELKKKIQNEGKEFKKKKGELESTVYKMFFSDGINVLGKLLQLSISTIELKKGKKKRETTDTENQKLREKLHDYRSQIVEYLMSFTEILIERCGSFDETKNLREDLLEVQQKLKKVDFNELHIEDVHTLEQELIQLVVKADIKIDSSRRKRATIPFFVATAIKAAKIVCKYGPVLLKVYKKYKNNQEKIQNLADAIEENENKNLLKLAEFEKKIMNDFTPMLENMFKSIIQKKNQFGSKNKVSLTFQKSNVQSILKSVIKEIDKTRKEYNFSAFDDLILCIERLKDAMIVQIEIFNHIQSYQEQQELVDFISVVHLKDPSKKEKLFIDLEILIDSNLLIHAYQIGFESFKQFVFPFAHIYLKDLHFPEHIVMEGDLNDLVDKISYDIIQIVNKLEFYRLVLKTNTPYLYHGEFNSRKVSTEPFFVWKNKENQNKISQLLSGQEVVFNANILRSSLKYEAVKFNLIELYFKSIDEARQSKLNDLLKFFQVKLTHLGDSHYKYKDKIYSIESNSHVILYYIEQNSKDSHVHVGGSYNDLKEGDYLLSPFALWKMHLMYIYKEVRNVTFADLDAFKNDTDLELNGHAIYAIQKLDNETIDMKVDFYYKPTEITEFFSKDKPETNETLSKDKPETNETLFKDKPETNESLSKNKPEYEHSKRDTSKQMVLDRTLQDNPASGVSSWLSYLRFPSFNFMPMAEAATSEDFNPIKLYNFAFEHSNQKIRGKTIHLDLSTTENKINSNVIKPDFLQIEFDFGNNCFEASNLKTSLYNNYNLVLAQLIVGKKYGSNKLLRNLINISPEHEKNRRLHELSLEVLPVLEKNFLCNHEEIFLDDYDNTLQWYQDLFRD